MDPNQAQHIGALMAGMGLFIGLIVLVFLIFIIFLLWRIFIKAGLAGPLALLVLIPGIGSLVVLCILAFAQWNVVPVAPPQYGALPPNYPPPPPPAYPPAAPPAQF